MCQEEYISPVDGSKGNPQRLPFRSSLCCPKGRGFGNCVWSNSQLAIQDGIPLFRTSEDVCLPRPCNSNKIQVADALSPPPTTEPETSRDRFNRFNCSMFSVPRGADPKFPLCCDPPSM